ncbi:ketoacyl-synt-domain-containing protein [Lojkania enalia]|uniref:Ketoacyl-synt-domain-containing protein n=1 Tax=Lojkania enalia TaxID=147567 RepID=A0A9P4K0J8_9PLEO|nr:ketoacyl-synt-domain-containing protein [Didymosphaeria enalia]
MSAPSLPAKGNTVLLFGPQPLAFNLTGFSYLRSTIWENSGWHWMSDVISELPECWEAFTNKFPQFNSVDGKRQLHILRKWFETGNVTGDVTQLSNTILSTLAIITHLVEYLRYREIVSLNLEQKQNCTATVGFCTGLLSAFAVSVSESSEQLQRHGATAVRLAALIGGVVDAQGLSDQNGPAVALVTAWNTVEAGEELKRILGRYPEAYISVAYDIQRATITTAALSSANLQQDLRSVGITVFETGLHGRFHNACYAEVINQLEQYFNSHSHLSFPTPPKLAYPTLLSNVEILNANGALHTIALRAILLEQSQWCQTIQSTRESWLSNKDSRVISFGPERCIPPSMQRELGSQIIHFADHAKDPTSTFLPLYTNIPTPRKCNDIAVIGMSVKVAGADDVNEFWNLLCEARSQHREVPSERFDFNNVWREKDSKRKWYGNFINNHDAFDHKFFKKSAREMASTDPQQRHMLQAAYQALEQAGYFTHTIDNKIGCFIGVCAADYENNVACYQPNAFTAIGNLKSFIAGKVSHYFGWTGPSMCIDTACSSSLVAIHQACQSILTGECTSALAGGANIMTQSLWFQNLAAASFLSPTGQCKPFDKNADGYCRGEGFAALYMKKMSTAIADGEQILGTISATAVLQNQNCTPIFVPNSPSLSDLFIDVVAKSQLEPWQISYAEAHGTGTQVGDPAEYRSIQHVFSAPRRSKPLAFGSVKGLIGHTECASGAVSLIKTLLMTHHKTFPPQASFNTMNESILVTQDDNMEIITKLRFWDDELRATLINNYGASGSNASMVVSQAPKHNPRTTTALDSAVDYPFRFFGTDERAIRDYAARFRRFLNLKAWSLGDLSFNVSRQSNPTLAASVIFSCRSQEELDQKLASIEDGDNTVPIYFQQYHRPVILCFGGQISTWVGLNRAVYDNSTILRTHLDQCDSVCRSHAGEGIFPEIFQCSPIANLRKLQTALFSIQYASAKSWIDCGINPVAVIGHSFGELTALCVSGALDLHDAMKMIIRRADIITQYWGDEKGSMIAVEADLHDTEQLLHEAGKRCKEAGEIPATIACFNASRSFTLAGSSRSIDMVVDVIATDPAFYSIAFKRLNISNAFHSTLIDPLIPKLKEMGAELYFNRPSIHLELATNTHTSQTPSSSYPADHMRNPVYFDHAIQRLSQKFPSAIYLEAGSNATITSMASKALGSPESCRFQAVNISTAKSMHLLTIATLNLWKDGLRTVHWSHSRLQTYDYNLVLLPPYQFEKSRHWLELKAPPRFTNVPHQDRITQLEEVPKDLYTFFQYNGNGYRSARFRINTSSPRYEELVLGHKIAQTAPICPATLEVDIAIEALMSLRSGAEDFKKFQPQIHDVRNQAALCIDPSRCVWLDLDSVDEVYRTWNWRITSEITDKASATLHASGQILLVAVDDSKGQAEFSRYERLTGHQNCVRLLYGSQSDKILEGQHIYEEFRDIVDYPQSYRALQRLVGKGDESAGRVVKEHSGKTWLDTNLSDGFSQVGGIWVNCMTDCDPADMYIATGFEKWVRSPTLPVDYVKPAVWDVLAKHHRQTNEAFLSDIFVFDSTNGALMEVILGVNYHRVPRASMRKMLARLTPTLTIKPALDLTKEMTSSTVPVTQNGTMFLKTTQSKLTTTHTKQSIPEKIRRLLAEICGCQTEDINDDSELADIGIDSLMGMELGRELETLFNTKLTKDGLALITNFEGLVDYVKDALNLSGDDCFSPSNGKTSTFHNKSGHSSLPPFTDKSGHQELRSKPELRLHSSIIIEAFQESKYLTDRFVQEYRCAGYVDNVLPKQTQLCVALAVEAFDQLGCNLRTAKAGQILEHITVVDDQKRLSTYLYKLLEKEAHLIDVQGDQIIRTAIALPTDSSEKILQELLRDYPDHDWANKLTYFAGCNLADVLKGSCDGIKLIFGTDEGRKLVTGLYGDSLLNKLANVQMQDVLARVAEKIPRFHEPLRILELGAGTAGTTKGMVDLITKLDIPIEYTFTDLSGSFVGAARRRFKDYPWMKFRVHDIEKPPPNELLGTQHIILGSNAIHATRSLSESAKNVRKFLRPDGFLMMLEMTQHLYWVDIIFGLFEGWWLFQDGRTHAIASETAWKTALHSAGYGHVDWTDGKQPETRIQRIIIAQALG